MSKNFSCVVEKKKFWAQPMLSDVLENSKIVLSYMSVLGINHTVHIQC